MPSTRKIDIPVSVTDLGKDGLVTLHHAKTSTGFKRLYLDLDQSHYLVERSDGAGSGITFGTLAKALRTYNRPMGKRLPNVAVDGAIFIPADGGPITTGWPPGAA